jgi:hypothetical protein
LDERKKVFTHLSDGGLRQGALSRLARRLPRPLLQQVAECLVGGRETQLEEK